MKPLFNYKSLIKVAVIMVVLALIASQMTNTYARESRPKKVEITNWDENPCCDQNNNVPQPTQTLPIGVVKCGETVTIFENHTFNFVIVTVTVSDYCNELDSQITAYRSTSNSTNVTIPDGNTVSGSFTIGRPAEEGKIQLECNGSSGYCLYTLEIDIPDSIF